MKRGLTEVSTADLKTVLKAVHRGDLPCPFDKSMLMAMGLAHVADVADTLVGLEQRAVRSVLVAVIAERMR